MPERADLETLTAELEGHGKRSLSGRFSHLATAVALCWSLWQLWIASPLPFDLGFGIFVDLPARSLHLAFGLCLAFLIFPSSWETGKVQRNWIPAAAAALSFLICSYGWLAYDGIVHRAGILLETEIGGMTVPVEAILGGAGVLLLLEATRRSIGLPLAIVCVIFLIYSVFGQSMPDVISHKGVSLERLIGYQWLSSEAIFGIPIDVSVSYVFLFVMFGSFLDKAGASKFFLDISFGLVGRYRGGPAKAAILASGLTGTVSGSSIANTVTTGAFTIPLMKKMGFPAHKAGAIEVAASTNGQLMPPIMGASAFIIAEFIGISYYDVIVHAAIPAVISYCALFYISHLESAKLGITGMPRDQLPNVRATLKSGAPYLVPLGTLIYLLLVERWSPSSAVFYAILILAVIICGRACLQARRAGQGAGAGLTAGVRLIFDAMIAGARNMAGVTAAVGAAGIIVGAVSSTGLNNAMLSVIEAVSQGNFYVLLPLVAFVCLVLGMGLPTTANYIVVASLMATVLVELGNASGLAVPLIAFHLYVLYFGLMADSTPPVCLAAFAASAISGANPMRTGAQSFLYDIRTSILPLVFIFNTELLLIGIDSFWHGLTVFFVSLIAILCFAAVTQGWLLTRLRWAERLALLAVVVALFRPDALLNRVYPEFSPLPLEAAMNGELPADRDIRLHIVRWTEYGDRYKLFVIPPESRDADGSIGLTATAENGHLLVTNLRFNGAAERAGAAFGDVIRAVDAEEKDRPPKEWIYPFGLLLLGLVILTQFRAAGSNRPGPRSGKP